MRKPPKGVLQTCHVLLRNLPKFERKLRDIRAMLIASGQWRVVTLLDKTWSDFTKDAFNSPSDWPSIEPAITEPTEPQPPANDSIPLRQHSFPALARPSRLKKESA